MASSAEFVPIYHLSQISQLYPSNIEKAQATRYQHLIEAFKKKFDRLPSFIARAPGRVNLIGEHIDYAGFGVLPMAISRDVLIAVASVPSGQETSSVGEGSSVILSNVHSSKYPDRKWNFEGKEKNVEIKNQAGIVEWSNYFKSGYKGILEHLGLESPNKMYCMTEGNVPTGSGLSSSSAFTCCATLATNFAHGASANLTKLQLAEMAAKSERLVGLGTGQMDQTASMCSLLDHALYIKFLPKIAVTPVKFPSKSPPLAFVIANSLVQADKVATAPTNYNLRVVETNLAAYYIGQRLGQSKHCEILKDVSDLYSGSDDVTIPALANLCEEIDQFFDKKEDGYSLPELSILLNLQESVIKTQFLSKYPVRAEKFHLYKRAKHVLEEALRVLKFYEACVNDKQDNNSEQLFNTLGDLMNQSHKSCRDLYNCSCKELDDLVDICLRSGARGSRLTGAGWGGCTVSLVPLPNVQEFIKKVQAEYYRPRFPGLDERQLEDVIFATTPGSGAAVVEIS